MNTSSYRERASNRFPIVALLTANAISMVGNNLGIVAVPWFVLETTGSAARTGVVAFATVLPTVLAAILGGALVDRVGNKRISVLADLVSGATVACIPLLHHTIGLEFWQLVLLVFLGALLDAPGNTARMAVVPELAEIGGVSLERTNGAAQAIQSGSVLLGPPLAGLLIAWLGASDVLWLNSASFAVSAAIVATMVPRDRLREGVPGRYLVEVREGLSFIRRDRFLFALLGIGAIANFAGAPLFSVVLPVYARNFHGTATDLGLILGGIGAGSLLGAIAFGSIGSRFPRRRLAIALSVASALPVAFLALEPPIWLAIAAMAISGFGDGVVNPLIITVIYEHVPAALRGRVLGSMLAGILAAAPLGMLLAGWAIEPLGIISVILAISALLLLVTVLFALTPALRDLGPVDASQAPASSAPGFPEQSPT
jgi:MFS family permease